VKPYVIAINAVSGGGKTALSTLLHESLPGSVLFSFDEFDDTNVHPEDMIEWFARGGNLEEFKCPALKIAVDAAIQGGVPHIILDYPFGRDHSLFRDSIDLSIWINTPPDVALARRIIRDLGRAPQLSPQDELRQLKEELRHYLLKARPVYLDERHPITADLVLDGMMSLEKLRDQILERIRNESAR
jgi:cytidylate kinase